jgi:hypothetical protein
MRRIDLTGLRFGRLVADCLSDCIIKDGRRMWECRCDCGKTSIVRAGDLRGGKTQSCGCGIAAGRLKGMRVRQAKAEMVHHKRAYHIWRSMVQRCTNPETQHFRHYGGRGIAVCERWKNSFKKFLADMGDPPVGLTLERNNNDGNYCPSNCRWATRKEQSRNTRRTVWVEFCGERIPLAVAAERLNIRLGTLHARRTAALRRVQRVFDSVQFPPLEKNNVG